MPLPSISRAYSCRMVALPDQSACPAPQWWPTLVQGPQGHMASLEAHLWSSHLQNPPIPAEHFFTPVPLFLSLLLCHFSNRVVTSERALLLSC